MTWKDEMKRWSRPLRRVPIVDRGVRLLRHEIVSLRDGLTELRAARSRGASWPEGTAPFLTWRPPGHYYSAVPDMEEIRGQADRIYAKPSHLVGLELNEETQLAMFETLAPLANDVAFNHDPKPDQRYFTNNSSYNPCDASIMQAFLRYLRPQQYLEVGSGWTTALALDTNDRWLGGRLQVTCIEPYPIDLGKLLRPTDEVEIIASRVQDVDLERFKKLGPGDVLFIDCSHVVRTGSDAHHLITRVLPIVPEGVYVHFHDIFWPFEYPREWIEEGRAWSEAYLLHAFLSFNSAFEIILWNDWIAHANSDVAARLLPAMGEGGGGSIWLRRA